MVLRTLRLAGSEVQARLAQGVASSEARTAVARILVGVALAELATLAVTRSATEAWFWTRFVAWWLILGLASSVGFGAGSAVPLPAHYQGCHCER